MLLKVEDLSCLRGGRRVFSGVSFELESGSLATLRGPNGCGKSTLLRALAGLLEVDRGRIELQDSSQAQDRDATQERIVYCGHLDAVKPNFTVLENLTFWAAYYGAGPEAEARARAALEETGLGHVLDAPAGYCSAGQKRRLGLARLAVIDRPIWLLDEPTVSLDAASAEALGEAIRRHLESGGMAAAATHLDLPGVDARVIDMSAFAPEAEAAEEDPFLAGGDWAES